MSTNTKKTTAPAAAPVATHDYRATLILDLRGVTVPVESVLARLKDTLAAVGAKVLREESLGQKTFVRVTDRKNPSGIYVQITFNGPTTAPAAFREKLRLDRTIKRLLVQSV
ncbi:MAG: 30S ribosomal protein S6 [Puniceicoccales bacterium]|jgi:small subunit ribosomal protein S6|nr:30S ribosomal protein S6 [Puniceicoccales bacterium]